MQLEVRLYLIWHITHITEMSVQRSSRVCLGPMPYVLFALPIHRLICIVFIKKTHKSILSLFTGTVHNSLILLYIFWMDFGYYILLWPHIFPFLLIAQFSEKPLFSIVSYTYSFLGSRFELNLAFTILGDSAVYISCITLYSCIYSFLLCLLCSNSSLIILVRHFSIFSFFHTIWT